MSWHEIINVILVNIRVILKVTIVSTVFLFLILFFIYPKTYQSTVSILPPEQENNFGGLGSILGNGDFSSLLTGGMSSASSQLFVEILKSRSAAMYVINKMNLLEFLNANDNIEAAEKLQDRLNTDISKEGIISINVDVKSSLVPLIFSDSDSLKNLAAKISNTYVEALDSINKEKLSSKAKNARLYIETQLEETRKLLDSAEVDLMNFQSKNKAVSVPDQVKATLDATVQLKSQIMQTEIQLGLVQSDAGESSKLYSSLSKKLQELKNQYSKFETGGEDYLLAFKDIPELGKQLAGLVREVRIQNEVFILLQQQFYKERIQENKDTPTVQILDEALPPLKHSKPKTLTSTIAGSIFIFLLLSMYFVIREKKNMIKKK